MESKEGHEFHGEPVLGKLENGNHGVPMLVNSYRDLKAAEAAGTRHDVIVRTSIGFLLALRSHREVSLRDEFAKAAIPASMAMASAYGAFNAAQAATAAYAVADAMLDHDIEPEAT